MGKTKINMVSGENPQPAKKKLSYEEKRASRAQKDTQVSGVSDQIPVNQATGTRNLEPGTRISSPVKIQREAEKQTNIQTSKAHGKKYDEARKKVDPEKQYPLTEAAKLVQETSYSKFPGTVELHLVLDKERGNVNTRIELSHSTGSSKKIEIASDETVEKLKLGKIDFDVLIATPEMMPKLVSFAKILGPRGLMPNPKNGTVVADPKKALANFSDKSVQIKTEKDAPLVHTTVAKTTQPEAEIAENTNQILETIGKKSIKKAVIAASMGPAIQLQVV